MARWERVVIGAAVAALPGIAAAACGSGDIGQVAECVDAQLGDIAKMLGGLSYVMGAVFGIKGIISLREHNESPQQVPLTRAGTRFIACAMLFALPDFMGTGVKTLFGGEATYKVVDHSGP